MTFAASHSAAGLPDQYHVMVADDSSLIRGIITRAVEENPQLKVTSAVGDGQMAVNALMRTPVDVIILDIEMPVMDGLTAIPKLLEIDRAVKIIVASTLSLKNADVSLRALTLGAADYLPKPSAREMASTSNFKNDLTSKILTYAQAARKAGVRRADHHAVKSAAPSRPASGADKILLRPMPTERPGLVAIGSSTGGPQALFNVVKAMGALPQPVIITQHMPASFTTILAEHISRQCNVKCIEAQDGAVLESGTYYVAPGDYHMAPLHRFGRYVLTLTRDPPENFCRPAVDPMLRGAVSAFGGKVLAVILTGMGQDGWKGCEKVVEAGGAVIAQDEASSVVWGMPGAVARAGLCSAVLPLDEIGPTVRRLAHEAGKMGATA